MNKRVWVDLSDLLKWHGPVTGIQRVTLNLALELNQIPDIDLHYFAADQFGFIEIAPQRAIEILRTKNEPQDSASRQRRLNMTTLRRRFIGFIKLALNQTPDLAQRWAFSFYVWLRNHLPLLSRKLLQTLLRRAFHSSFPTPFERNDWVLILGNGWDSNLGHRLHELREQIGFKLGPIVFDMIPILFPQFFRPGFALVYETYVRQAIQSADLLIAISESTRNDILSFADDRGLRRPSIKVIRLGDSRSPPERQAIQELSGQEFVLSVGTIEVRKNHASLVGVWKDLMSEGKTLPYLVLVGRMGWLVEELFKELRENSALKERVKILEHASDSELSWLYAHCLFTVYPSLYEGWGLPVAESLSHGKICIASANSSIPEISPLVDLIDAKDQAALRERVWRYLKNPEEREAKEAYIRREFTPTAWSHTAHQIAGALKNQ